MPSVRLLADGFVVQRVGRREALGWTEVVEVRGELLNQVTYDECFLVFVAKPSNVACVGELDDGFDEFEQTILNRFPSVPLDWKNRVEAAGYDAQIVLWPNATTS